ncbi:NAD-dependent epimerase/dehydratase family protein [uncultured Enterococcus sp.]|uniref:NAD-dependent epimerase/dehydratase family protein n=1 Tax=uncultured Enterococcus sp. TaxID=167972 RepID=UPI0025F3E24A|nr:NAD-dependent epimerase/dehydratase family protein [uncultured Enterococcus sp.]
MEKQRIVIFGGSGFVGQAIAKRALANQYEVISISRSGRPKGTEPWFDQIQFIQADVFDAKQWHDTIKTGDILVDAIGILTEKKAKNLTYRRYHYEIVKIITQAVSDIKHLSFIYISASQGVPFHPGYLREKQRAEVFLENIPLPSAIVRPSLLYGKGRKYSTEMAKAIFISKKIPGVAWLLRSFEPRPVEWVGDQVIAKLTQLESK